jgi:hypothetical protein
VAAASIRYTPAFLAGRLLRLRLISQPPQCLVTAQHEEYAEYSGRYSTPSQSSAQWLGNIAKFNA